MKLKVLVIMSVLFVASGCAKTPHKSAPAQPQQPEMEPEPVPTSVYSSKREITLTQYLQFKYQHYTCDELSERLLLIERQLPYMEEEVIQFFINDIEVIYWSATEKSCRVIIQPFEETQEKADKELDSETAIGAALAD